MSAIRVIQFTDPHLFGDINGTLRGVNTFETLERALAWIQDDELVEVTPKTIRLRKLYLDPNERKRFEKQGIKLPQP